MMLKIFTVVVSVILSVNCLKVIETQDRLIIAITGGPRYSRSFYLQIRLFTLENWSKITIFQSKMDFLSVISRFAVQNDGTYLPRITRETCIVYLWSHFWYLSGMLVDKEMRINSDILLFHSYYSLVSGLCLVTPVRLFLSKFIFFE